MPLSPYSEAWEKWRVENAKSFDPLTLKAPEDQRQFLENRLHRAYTEGMIKGAEIVQDDLVNQIRKFFLNIKVKV